MRQTFHPSIQARVRQPRNPTKSTNRGKTSAERMLEAVRRVKIDKCTIRGTAKDYDNNFQTLRRYCSKFTDNEVGT